MRQYKYILFKDGNPWKGMFSELDFMNEYSQVFEKVLRETESWFGDDKLAEEFAIIKFFRTFQPVTWDYAHKCYRSLFRDYILGEKENEGSIVYGIEWEDMNLKERALFKFLDEQFQEHLQGLNIAQKFDDPIYGVSRGTGALTAL